MKHLKLTVSGTFFVLMVQAAVVRAEITCKLADYRGTYAFYATGAFLDLPPEAASLAGPFAEAGTFTTDGQGNLTIEAVNSFNGIILPSADPATYTLTPQCELEVSIVLPILNVPATFFGVLAEGNRRLNLTISDPPGTVVIGTHLKQDKNFCGTADFAGAYQIDLSGGIAQSHSRPGIFFRTGRLVADGNGRFTATTLAVYAGVPVVENFSGTYSMNARCNLTLNYTYNGENISLTGPIAGRGEVVAVTVASPGWAVSGVLRAQQ